MVACSNVYLLIANHWLNNQSVVTENIHYPPPPHGREFFKYTTPLWKIQLHVSFTFFGLTGCKSYRVQRFCKFLSEFKCKRLVSLDWNILRITSGCGPLISVRIFQLQFTVPFLTNYFALIREFGKEFKNGKSHSYWLVHFYQKMSFNFPQVFPVVSDKLVWHNKMIMKIKDILHADITYSSIDAVNALALYTCALHQWKFVEVNFWFFWWRPIL